jgi:hypothetical protein
MGDAETALHWLTVALAVCPKGKFGQLGQLHYLQGRAYTLMCESCHDERFGSIRDLDQEMRHARSAEEHFHRAYKYYRFTDDLVHQVRVSMCMFFMLRIPWTSGEVSQPHCSPPCCTCLCGCGATWPASE